MQILRSHHFPFLLCLVLLLSTFPQPVRAEEASQAPLVCTSSYQSVSVPWEDAYIAILIAVSTTPMAEGRTPVFSLIRLSDDEVPYLIAGLQEADSQTGDYILYHYESSDPEPNAETDANTEAEPSTEADASTEAEPSTEAGAEAEPSTESEANVQMASGTIYQLFHLTDSLLLNPQSRQLALKQASVSYSLAGHHLEGTAISLQDEAVSSLFFEVSFQPLADLVITCDNIEDFCQNFSEAPPEATVSDATVSGTAALETEPIPQVTVILDGSQNPAAYASDSSKADTSADSSPETYETEEPLTVYHVALDLMLPEICSTDLAELKAINPEVVCWIQIPGTTLNGPVVQTTDNTKYLHAGLDTSFQNTGTFFLDYRDVPAFEGFHTFIYGHNHRMGQLFHCILYYEDPDYYEEHPEIIITTETETLYFQIFSFYRVYENASTYVRDGLSDQEYLDILCEESLYDTGVTVSTEDRILTLSTCTNEWDTDRYVLHAKLVESSEEETVH